MTASTLCPNVFDAGLPTLTYEFAEAPADVYPRIRVAQAQAAIAVGPFGPEILSHELVRTVLRDPRLGSPMMGLSGPTTLPIEFGAEVARA